MKRPAGQRRAVLIGCLLLSGLTAACKQEIAFTRVPGLAAGESRAAPAETTIFHAVAIDVAAVRAAADAAIGHQIAKWRAFHDDIACDTRKGPWLECMGATVSAEYSRAGAIDVAVQGGRLVLVVPMRYDISARGHGWAAYLADHKSGKAEVRMPIEASLGPGYRLDVRAAGEMVWTEKAVPLLKGKVFLNQSADAKLKADIKAAGEPLRRAFGEDRLKAAAGQAWSALHAPIALMRAPDVWLASTPVRVLGGGFAVDRGEIVYRLGVATRVAMHQGAPPPTAAVKALPDPARATEPEPRTRLKLPVDVAAVSLQQAIAAAFPPGQSIETRADNKAKAVNVVTRGVAVFPSKEQIAIELKLEVKEPSRMAGMTGSAYFVARPVFSAQTGILELTDIGFPASGEKSSSKDTRTLSDAVRIGEEPFAGRLYLAGRLDIGREIATLLPRINEVIEQPLGDGLALSGRFDRADAGGIEPHRDGFRVNLDLTGLLTLSTPERILESKGALQQTDGKGPPPKIKK